MRPFAALKMEAASWLQAAPADQWRLRCSMLADGGGDLERFFGRRAWDVASSDVWRWVAACTALRDLDRARA